MKRITISEPIFKIVVLNLFFISMHLQAMDITISRESKTETCLRFGSQKKITDTVKQTAVSFGLEMVTTGVVRFSEVCGEIVLKERPLDSLFVGPWPPVKKRTFLNFKERIHQFLLPQDYLKRDMPLWKKVIILGISPVIAAASMLALKQGLNRIMPEDGSINNALDSVALSRLFDLFPSSDLDGKQINNGASLAVLLGVMSEETAKSRVLWGMHFVASYHARNSMANYLDATK